MVGCECVCTRETIIMMTMMMRMMLGDKVNKEKRNNHEWERDTTQ